MSGRILISSSISKRAIICFYCALGKTITETRSDLVSVYGEDAPALSTIHRWFERYRVGRADLYDNQRPGRPPAEGLDDSLKTLILENPHATAREMAEELGHSVSTITEHLHAMGLHCFQLRWVPHALTDQQKATRAGDAMELLSNIRQLGVHGASTIFTSDESWFNHDNPHTAMWCETREDALTRPKQTIARDKTLVVVFWNFVGFSHVIAVPSGQTYTSEFCTSVAIPSFDAALRSNRPRLGLARTCLHWDNAKPHVANHTRENLGSRGVRLLPHPSYSPDLAPSDFFLFGYLKGRIMGQKFATSPELVANLSQIMSEIGKSVLQNVYEEWMGRLVWVITHYGEYYHT